MTSSSERLDRIERILEAVAQRQEINTRSIELLGQRVDSNSKAIAANSSQIAEVRDALSEAAGRTLRALDELREIVEEERVNFQEYRQRNDTNVASVNASVERLDAILQQLMRRQQNDSGDHPQV